MAAYRFKLNGEAVNARPLKYVPGVNPRFTGSHPVFTNHSTSGSQVLVNGVLIINSCLVAKDLAMA